MTKKNEVKNIDVTKSGPMTFRQLQEANSWPYNGVSQEFLSFSQSIEAATAPTSLYDARAHSEQLVESPLANQPTRWGESMFDAATATEAQFQNLGDIRAENQPWYAKIGAGIGKAVVYAGTTFANGTAGLLYGLGKWAAGGNFSDVWNNEITVTMDDIMKASEEVMPNYRTQYEQEHPMALENIFSANFLGDTIIKNIGFIVGAYYSGGIFSKGAGLLCRALGASKGFTSATAQLTGSFMSAANEGGIEALGAANEFEEQATAHLDQVHAARIEEIKQRYLANRGKNFVPTSGDTQGLTDEAYLTMQAELEEAQRDYEAAKVKIQEDKARVGNVTFGLNMAILTPSNIAQFGRLYSKGFNTNRRMVNNTRKLADGTQEIVNKTRAGKAFTIAKGGIWEGGEEVSQQIAADVSKYHYNNDVFDYYRALLDDKENYQTQSWVQSVQESLFQTLGEESTWEQFLSGTIMGLMGMPGFRSAKTKDGKWQSPITLQGNAWSRYKEMNEEQQRAEGIVNYINGRINSKGDFNAYYQGLLRRNKLDKSMLEAAERGDEFDYKNSEFAQLISDVEMFNSVGRSEDLISMVTQSLETSDENIESIIKSTTKTTQDGKLDGPFAQYAVLNKDGSIGVNFGSEQSKQEVKDAITKKVNEVVDTVKNYNKTRDQIDNITGGNLTNDQLNYLSYMSLQLDNWQQRAEEMSGDVKSGIEGALSTLQSQLHGVKQARDTEGARGKGAISDEYKGLDGIVQDTETAINRLEEIRNSDAKAVALNLTQNSKFTEALIDVLEELPSKTLDELQKKELLNKLQDLIKVGKASELFNRKFKEYLKSPEKLTEEKQKVEEQVKQEQTEQKTQDLKTTLSNAKNLSEFREILNEYDDQEVADNTLKELQESGNELAKKHSETSQYQREVMRALDNLDLDSQTKDDALKLFQDQFDNSEDLSQLANPNSIYANNQAAFDEDSQDIEQSQTRFQNARYTLQSALTKVNNDNKFKDKFSDEYKSPAKSKEQQADEKTKEQTKGKSKEDAPITTESPVGDITFDQVQDENKKANQEEAQEPTKKEPKKFYRPAVPELHIEASRDGNFETFDRVAKTQEGQYYYIRAKKLNAEENVLVEQYIEAHPDEPKSVQLIRNALKEKLDKGNKYLEGVLSSPLPNFDSIYEYFVQNEVFKYLNQGNLHTGDKIAFMIDPEFEEKVKNEPWHTRPVIFMINKKDGHVVGSLDSAASSISGYEGLEDLEQGIIEEYSNRATPQASKDDLIHITNTSQGLHHLGTLQDWSKKTSDIRTKPDGFGTENGLYYYKKSDKSGRGGDNITIWFKTEPSQIVKDSIEQLLSDSKNLNEFGDKLVNLIRGTQSEGKFIATPTTRVSKIMVGKIPYSNQEQSLRTIPNINDGQGPIFGIVKNGILTTNGLLDDSLVTKPQDMSNKEGRLYLLIPNGAGKYSPVAVRVKHFNKEEFNLDDTTNATTEMGKAIKGAIEDLSKATSQEDVKAAVKKLTNYLHLQDVHINWFQGSKGNGIVIGRDLRNSDGSYKKVTINGEEHIERFHKDIYFVSNPKTVTKGGISYDATTAQQLGMAAEFGASKDPEQIYKEILDVLLGFNLPFQVNAREINSGNYNQERINSDILTSNISRALSQGTWFTTDYFNTNGELQPAVNPAARVHHPVRDTTNPAGGTDSAIKGIPITINGNLLYHVDINTGTIYDKNGRVIKDSKYKGLLFDLAWAQNTFGDARNSAVMVDNKVITPSGQVLDRTTQKYLTGKEAQDVKDTIQGKTQQKEVKVNKSNQVVQKIQQDQSKVDKSRTDNEYYYVQEEDGQYHKYERVHKRIGNIFTQELSAEQTALLKDISASLQRAASVSAQNYQNYLKNLENKYGVDLKSLYDKSGSEGMNKVLDAIRQHFLDPNNNRAVRAGSSVDSVIRQYFTVADVSTIVRPDNLSEKAFNALLEELSKIKESMERRGERFLTNNIVLFHKYEDGTRVAGEVDILSVDKDGNFKIYDVKTGKWSFTSHQGLNLFDWTIDGKPATREEIQEYINKNFRNKFTLKSSMSTKEYYALQLSAYKNLLESAYGAQVSTLGILPFVLTYRGDQVVHINKESGIPITHNPAVSVPLESSVSQEQRQEPQKQEDIIEAQPEASNIEQEQVISPILNTSLEKVVQYITKADTHITSLEGGPSTIYFELNGKIYKSHTAKPFIEVNGVQLYVAKERTTYEEDGGQIDIEDYFVIFPNGKTFTFLSKWPKSKELDVDQLISKYGKMFTDKSEKVKEWSQEETLITKALESIREQGTQQETPVEQPKSTLSEEDKANIQKLGNVDNKKASRRRRLREAPKAPYKVWNKEEELAWLDKVLPNLSKEDRVKIVEGLIHVVESGTAAYGQFDGAVVTLSNIAAEGTTYHEAFHVVFNLLLDDIQRKALLSEYRDSRPEMDDIALEEELAEDFREFIMQGGKDTRSLGRKIIDFFKALFIKTKYWKDFRPSSIYYFKQINDGKFANRVLGTTNFSRQGNEEYTQEMQDILAKAPRDKQGRLLAPNDKPSNLTERQYAQVRTKAFKDWFGDWENNPKEASKVVDENGEPLVVYHGSPSEDINIFKHHPNKAERIGGRGTGTEGFYFTPNKDYAERYKATHLMRNPDTSNGKIYEVFLNVRNLGEFSTTNPNLHNVSITSFYNMKESDRTLFENIGYDGLLLGNILNNSKNTRPEIVVFNPNQIKSATDNIGTFDSSNPDIRYRRTNGKIESLELLRGPKIEIKLFDSLGTNTKDLLLKKGWTEKSFNSVSQEERDYALNCIAF